MRASEREAPCFTKIIIGFLPVGTNYKSHNTGGICIFMFITKIIQYEFTVGIEN